MVIFFFSKGEGFHVQDSFCVAVFLCLCGTVRVLHPHKQPRHKQTSTGPGVVDLADFLQFVSAFGSSAGDDKYQAKFDLDGSGTVDLADFLQFVNVFGQTVPESVEPPPTADSVEGDRAALVALYNATDGNNWTDNTNWLSDRPLNQWHGVGTNEQGRVAWLDLPENQLSGSYPSRVGQPHKACSLGVV